MLDKPAGLVVHPAPGNEDGTLVNALLAHCGDTLPGIGGERRPGIVHRLDKDTSGVMVVAKTEPALATLSAAFAARDLDRAYLALVLGPAGARLPARSRAPSGATRATASAWRWSSRGGKPALTRYRTLRRLARRGRRCWNAGWRPGAPTRSGCIWPVVGHPLVGDPVYLRRIPADARRRWPPPLRAAAARFPPPGAACRRLGFAHPVTGETLSFETPPPADMALLLARLDEQQQNTARTS